MPHVVVKLWPGRSEQQKAALARDIVAALQKNCGSTDASISVAIEEVASADWMQQVYESEIAPAMERLYKKPGYGPS
jgi:4-oxalocrotonate tautomerase